MKIRFLLDENRSPRLRAALLRLDPAIDILRVGDEGAPPLGMLDPDILRHLEQAQRLLVTGNRKSMPGHITAYLATGGHHWGIFRIRTRATMRQLVDDLYLLWEASEAEEWVDQMRWVPL